jgi:DNA-binding transcriptional regulator YbjK
MTAQSQERRTRIADAALEVLAEHGARGLTHRAVDAEVGLPSGSTSYYYPTRASLLLAAAERLVELDTRDLDALPSDLAGVAALVRNWSSGRSRSRSLARMELLLTAARDPAFRFMKSARKLFLDRVVQADPKRSKTTATALVALVDGLLLHNLVLGSPSRAETERVLAAIRAPAGKPRRKRKRH